MPAHGEQLGKGDGATPAKGRAAPKEMDAVQKAENPVTLSIY